LRSYYAQFVFDPSLAIFVEYFAKVFESLKPYLKGASDSERVNSALTVSAILTY
jgi:hypothetical protein